MTAAPTHSSISLEVKQGNPEVSTAPVVLRRSERLVNKPRLPPGSAPTKMTDSYSCEFESLPCANPIPILVIRRPATTREPLSISDSAGATCRAGAERNSMGGCVGGWMAERMDELVGELVVCRFWQFCKR